MVLVGSCSHTGTRYGFLNQDCVVSVILAGPGRRSCAAGSQAAPVEGWHSALRAAGGASALQAPQILEDLHSAKELKKNRWHQLHCALVLDGERRHSEPPRARAGPPASRGGPGWGEADKLHSARPWLCSSV